MSPPRNVMTPPRKMSPFPRALSLQSFSHVGGEGGVVEGGRQSVATSPGKPQRTESAGSTSSYGSFGSTRSGERRVSSGDETLMALLPQGARLVDGLSQDDLHDSVGLSQDDLRDSVQLLEAFRRCLCVRGCVCVSIWRISIAAI